MDALQRAKASRRGGRSFVTKLAHAITEADDEVTPQSILQADKETIDLVLSQLSAKKCQLEELDQMILAAITTEQELEDEVTDAEMYHYELAEKIATLGKFSTASTTTRTNQPAPPTPIQQDQQLPEQCVVEQSNREDTDQPGNAISSISMSNTLSHTPVVHNVGQSVCQLPKLTLPTFSGDSLQFQTFWDSFEAAIHNNKGLTGVQKFHYLRAQLLGDAAHVIDNLPLTDKNYEHSVALLKDRFGQPYKLVSAYMDALMNLPKPANNRASLQAFHDKLESHMRALQSLGKSRDSYCAMLTPMVLGKLPLELKKQFAREHSSGGWTIKDIMACILKEIRVLELGYYSNSHSHSTAASFHTAARKPLAKQGNKELACTYCKGPRTANQCTVIKDHQQRTTIVKAAGLCFNCLANHRVSQCTSCRRCKQCNQKHHTTLCPPAVSTPPSLPSPANSSVQLSPTPTNLKPPHNNSGVQPTLPPQLAMNKYLHIPR